MRILGLDIGRTSIRAVELEAAFGRYELRDHHEHPIAPNNDPFQSAGELVRSLQKPPEKIAVGLPSDKTLFRNLKVPTRDRKAVRSAVMFELEDEVPFELEDSAYDYTVLQQGSEGTHVHIATTLKKSLEDFIQGLNAAGIDPDVVSTETSSIRLLLQKTRPKEKTTKKIPGVMLVLIGYDRSTVYAELDGNPFVTRSIRWGGNLITKAVSQKYQIPWEEAEKAKLDSGFVLSSAHKEAANADQVEFSETIYQPISELLLELRQALLTYKKYTQTYPEKILIGGGTSLLPGLRPAMEDELGIPVRTVETLSQLSNRKINYAKSTDVSFSLAAGLGLSLVSSERTKTINLRKGIFSKTKQSREFKWANYKRPLLAVGLVLLCIYGSAIAQNMVYQSRMDSLDRRLERSIKSFFGGISKSAVRSYLANPSRLKKNIQKDLDKKIEMSKLIGENPKSPLGFLRNTSDTISKSLVVDMIDYKVGSAPKKPYSDENPTTASMTFLVDSQAAVKTLVKALEPLIEEPKSSKPKQVPSPFGGVKKKWRVTITGTPKEEAYGF